MNEDDLREFIKILKTFERAMLVTRRDSELRSRPMRIADRTNDGRVWFVTSIESGKLDELTEHHQVNVSMQEDNRFLSISGTARMTRDRDKVNEVWSEAFHPWFPKGREDPTLVLLEIVPTYVEYWDRSGMEAIRYSFAAARSAVTGETPEPAEGTHGKVDFPKTSDSEEQQLRGNGR